MYYKSNVKKIFIYCKLTLNVSSHKMLSFILGNHNSTIIHCKQHNACFQKKSNYQILIQYIQKDYSFIEVFFYFICYAFFKSRQSMNVFKCIYLSSHLHTVSTYEYMSYEKKMKQKYRPLSYKFVVIDFSIFIIKYLHVLAKATMNKS